MKNNIDKNNHYFTLMRPLNYVPCIGWAYTSSTDKEEWVECEVVEDRYIVSDGYKVTLKAIDKRYGSRDFYQSDFESLLDKGYIIKKTGNKQHVEEIKWYEYLTEFVPVVFTGSILVDEDINS